MRTRGLPPQPEPPVSAVQNSQLLNEQIGRLLSGRLRWLLSKRFVIWLL